MLAFLAQVLMLSCQPIVDIIMSIDNTSKPRLFTIVKPGKFIYIYWKGDGVDHGNVCGWCLKGAKIFHQ